MVGDSGKGGTSPPGKASACIASRPPPEGDRIFLSTATATAEAAASDEAVEAVKAAAAAAREVVQQCLPRGVSKESAVECQSEIL